jgi:cell division protein FtsL
VVFTVVAVAAFLGMVLTRTALDRSAIDLASIERQIAEAKTANQLLRLEIGRLESPARIAPLAAQMGMVYPPRTEKLMVAGVIPDGTADPRWADLERLSVGADPEGDAEWASDGANFLAAGSLANQTDPAADEGGTTP